MRIDGNHVQAAVKTARALGCATTVSGWRACGESLISFLSTLHLNEMCQAKHWIIISTEWAAASVSGSG